MADRDESTRMGLTRGVGLLERAISYALGSVSAVTPECLARPTPCAEWDLRALLRHANESLGVLREGIDGAVFDDRPADLVATFRDRACGLLGAWTTAGARDRPIAVGDLPLMASIVAGTGAIEIAVHGWDIFRACGQHNPIPPALAADMLAFSRLVVADTARAPQFAAPVAVPSSACPSDRLVAFLGRDPR